MKHITHAMLPFHLELDVDPSQTPCKDIQERGVRNYTHSTRDALERPRTLKVGGRTYVTPHDAKERLSQRSRFVHTRQTN